MSVFFPLVGAVGASVEDSGRFVTRSDLNLHEIGALAPACTHVRTRHRRCVRVTPCLCTTENVVDLLALKVHLVLKLGVDAVDVGARPAEEPKVLQCLLGQQNVRARGTEKHLL